MPDPSPGTLASRLLAFRVTANLTGVRLEELSGVSRHKISKVEKGHRLPNADDIRAWVKACGGTTPQADELVALLVGERHMSSWADMISAGGQAAVQRSYHDRITTADHIVFHDPMLIPGPLQTEPYARRLLSWSEETWRDSGSAQSTVEEAVRWRMESGRLVRSDREFTFVLAAASLSTWYLDRDETLDQVTRLLDVLSLKNVWFGVIPAHRQLDGMIPPPFQMFDDVVISEGAVAELTDIELAGRYRQRLELAKRLAVTGRAARELIRAEADLLR